MWGEEGVLDEGGICLMNIFGNIWPFGDIW